MSKIDILSEKINIFSSPFTTISRKNAQSTWDRQDILPSPFKLPGFLVGIWKNFSLWFERAQQRKELSELSDHQLKDIGITRDEAEMESNKKFWEGKATFVTAWFSCFFAVKNGIKEKPLSDPAAD